MPALVTARQLKEFFKDEADHGNEEQLGVQAGVNGFSSISPSSYNHLLLINPGEKAESLTRDVASTGDGRLGGKVVGPDGKRVAGVRASTSPGTLSEPLEKDTFTVEGINPRRPHIWVSSPRDRKYGAALSILGELKDG